MNPVIHPRESDPKTLLPPLGSRGMTPIRTPDEVGLLIQEAYKRKLSGILIEAVFRTLPSEDDLNWVLEVQRTEPYQLRLTYLLEREGQLTPQLYEVQLDLPEVRAGLKEILQLPVPFIGYQLSATFYVLGSLQLPNPVQVWDLYIAEKALRLGLYHWRYFTNMAFKEGEISAKRRAQEKEGTELGLHACCKRYGVKMDAEGSRTPVGKAHQLGQLYFKQVAYATQSGMLHHLLTIEMPWVVTNARMSWVGLRVDRDKGEQGIQAAYNASSGLKDQLNQMGIADPDSSSTLFTYFKKKGLTNLPKVTFSKEWAKGARDARYPEIEKLYEYRKATEWLNLQLLNPEFRGQGGRVHPQHIQLGTATGRQNCRNPSVLNLSKEKRNLILPRNGYGIGEVDLSQVEVLIIAAIYSDPRLLELCRDQDVYSSIAQYFYRSSLSEEERTLPSAEFKQRHPEKRAAMKVCTLGMVYGYTPQGMAENLKITVDEAQKLSDHFKQLFPDLVRNQNLAKIQGRYPGYTTTATGLRRYRGRQGTLTSSEERWLINFPIQGTAAALFKLAGNRLDRLLPHYRAHLLIPLHDSYIFEAPLEELEKVANLVAQQMCQAIQEYFPQLNPKVEINIAHPQCWNKEGDFSALDHWIEEAAL